MKKFNEFLEIEYEVIADRDGISEINLRDLFTKSYNELPWLVENYNCIYLITNLINGKVYVGQTTYFNRRFNGYLSHKTGLSSINNYLYNSIRSDKSRNFKVEILETDLMDLNESEVFWIKYFNSFGKNGYNLNSGGNINDHLNSEEVKRHKIELYGELMGACRTEEALSKMRLNKSLGFLSDSIYSNLEILKTKNLKFSAENYIYNTKAKIFRHLVRVFNKIKYLEKLDWWRESHTLLFSEIYNYCYERWRDWTIENFGPSNPLLNINKQSLKSN